MCTASIPAVLWPPASLPATPPRLGVNLIIHGINQHGHPSSGPVGRERAGGDRLSLQGAIGKLRISSPEITPAT